MKKIISILASFAMIIVLVSCANVQKSDWQDLLDLGQKYLLDGDYEQAIIEFNKVIEIEPKNVDAYLGLAEAYVAAGDYDSAISVLEQGYAETENQALQDRINELRGLAAEQTEVAITTSPETTTVPETTAVSETTTEAVTEDNVAKDFEWTFEDGLLTVNGHGDMPEYTAWNAWSSISKDVKSVVINDGITNISTRAFSDFDNLESVTISDSVLSIGNDAFSDCDKLKSVYIPNSVIEIGDNPWVDCYSMNEIDLENNDNFRVIDGVLFTKDLSRLITYPRGKSDTYYEIPYGVETIGANAFYWNNDITEIYIPESVTTIEKSAFVCCEHIVYMSIPKSVTKIEGNPWVRCGRLGENAKIEMADNDYYCSVDDFIFTKDMKKMVAYLSIKPETSYTIPNGVEIIGEEAFPGFCKLESITIPKGVKIIEDNAFCGNMKTLFIPDGVESIGDMVFSGGYELETVHLPASVKSIGYTSYWLNHGNPPTFYAPSGSYAEQYANENRIPFVAE